MCGCRRTSEGLNAPAATTVVLMRSSLMGHSFTLSTVPPKMKSKKKINKEQLWLMLV